MNLHLDKNAFSVIVDEVYNDTNIRRDVLEKDYYVTLLLKELSKRSNQDYAYFKGGTALYKALKSIRRFSEDIDLTVYVEDCPTPSQAQKRLENASLKFTYLPKGKTLENKRGSVICEYLYDSMYEIDNDYPLHRFGNVKVEATSFTVSEPTEKLIIAPYLYEVSNFQNKEILSKRYGVQPFEIATISLERIFIDKVFATEYYWERKDYERKWYGDVAKHVYDITILLDNDKIKQFLSDKNKVQYIVQLKRQEEVNRLGGVSANLKMSDFGYFKGLIGDSEFSNSFQTMQNIYVLDKREVISEDKIFSAIKQLRDLIDIE